MVEEVTKKIIYSNPEVVIGKARGGNEERGKVRNSGEWHKEAEYRRTKSERI